MLTNKLQMLASLTISNEQKVLWLMEWNKSSVLKETKKFSKQRFYNFMFDKWLHKATFWSHVPLFTNPTLFQLQISGKI
jgi:hypothetical protein